MEKLIVHIKDELKEFYPEDEIQTFVRIILSYVLDIPFAQVLADPKRVVSNDARARVEAVLERMKLYEPIQYIIGETEFMGLPFNVNQDTLIPRPETEELIEHVVEENIAESLRVLDIGTGSGCIAISLAKYLRKAQVSAWDFSEGALCMAQKNAGINGVVVDWAKVDVLSSYPVDKQFDIIVSNPPYVMESEKEGMEENVLKYEPHTALFVSDDNALIFYERIADIATHLLTDGGRIYFEINQAKGKEMLCMMKAKGFSGIALYKDISGRNRIIRGIHNKHK